MDINEEALKLHEENRGKIEVISKTEARLGGSLYPRSCRALQKNSPGRFSSIQIYYQRKHGSSGD
jgi:hypothetical protein